MKLFLERVRSFIFYTLIGCFSIAPISIGTCSVISTNTPARIIGSSTAFPFMAVVTERLQQDSLLFPPIVESTGTGAGLNILCSTSQTSPYIATASRPIKLSEKKLCKKNFNQEIFEYTLGLDGLVIVAPKSLPIFSITRRELYLALSSYIPSPYSQQKTFIPNPYRLWSDINSSLPSMPIKVYGPPSNSGLYEAFTHLVMEPNCSAVTANSKRLCQKIRSDGVYMKMPENSKLLLEKLQQDFNALGIVSYRLFDQNRSNLQALPIENINPSSANIRSGSYGLSRKLYLYIKEEDRKTPYVINFLNYLKKKEITGPGGAFEELGLILP